MLIRKNSYGYKTSKGAEVNAILLSVIQSCRLNGINVWNDLVSVLGRSEEAHEKPESFLPWIYRGEQAESDPALAA